MDYISAADDERGTGSGCVFCDRFSLDQDEESLIVWRGVQTFVILNAYPYNTGHVLVLPNEHEGDLGSLDAGARAELFETGFRATEVISRAMGAEGFNVGMNLGASAGAGIPGHLHLHVVPRWSGDTNFMPVTGETKVLPEMLADTYRKLKPLFDASR